MLDGSLERQIYSGSCLDRSVHMQRTTNLLFLVANTSVLPILVYSPQTQSHPKVGRGGGHIRQVCSKALYVISDGAIMNDQGWPKIDVHVPYSDK